MGTRQADDAIPQSGTAMKRRGILRAAGTAVGMALAGIAAKQTSAPVAATTTDTNFVANGSAAYGFDTFPGTFTTGVYGRGTSEGVFGSGGTYGVYGSSGSNGVYGNGSTTGVYGFGNTTGVYGNVSGSTPNTIAVQGQNNSTGAGGHGVVGQSAKGYGVLGYSTGGSASLAGVSTNVNIPAFAGGNSVGGGLAAAFSGTVYINGRLVVVDPSYKSGLLAHPDGSHRLVYCVESPESWIEDFGKGTLTNGKADVRLDPDFAAVVQTQDYAVFPVALADCKGLYIANQTVSGFEVHEMQGGTSSTPFRYRVVARPKTDKKTSRLEKFTPPVITLPDVATLPTPGAVPTPPPAPAEPPQAQPPARASAPSAPAPVAAPPGNPPSPVPPAPPPRP